MLALAKQHLQQHAQLAAAQFTEKTRQQQQQQQKRKPPKEQLLADFPLAPVSNMNGQTKSKSKSNSASSSSSLASSNRSPAFKAKSARRSSRHLLSSSQLKRAKSLAKKLPRPSLLEQAERSLDQSDMKGIEERNLRLLTHQSERKMKTKEAMKKILLATTLPSRHAKPVESEEDEDDERDDFDDAEIADLMD